VRLLGAFYLRLTGQSLDIYRYIEPLYNDMRRIVVATPEGRRISHVDEFAWQLLHENFVCDISLPHIPKRCMLEKLGLLERRISALEIEEPSEPAPPQPQPQAAPKPTREEEHRHGHRERQSGPHQSHSDHDTAEAMDVAEMNKLRASLGLKPLH